MPATTTATITATKKTAAPRRASAAAARRLRANLADPALPDLPGDLAAVLAGFHPGPPVGTIWPRLRPLAGDILPRAGVRGADSFRKQLTHLGHFYVWAEGQGLPISAETLVRRHVDEYTRIGMPASSPKSRADRRARLRRLADKIHPAQAPGAGSPGVEVARPTVRPPYTDREVAALVRTAWNQPTAERTRKAALCIGLGLGAGLDSRDFRGLRVAHIQDERAGVTVHVPGTIARSVPVRVEFVDLVRRGLEGRESDDLVLGRVEDRRNLCANALADVVVLGRCPRIEQSRLRSTWLAALLRQPVRLDVLMAAAGLKTARTLPDLIPHIEPPDPGETIRSLRGTGGVA